MKKIFLLLIIQCAYNILNAQNVAINTSGATAVASAMLDITSTTSGVLIPRMTQAQRNAIGTPATSLLIYQTDNTPGFYFYNGVTWVPLFSTNTGWSITGNAGTVVGTNFLGTTDNVSLAINTNNLERMRVLNTGQVAVNSTTTFGVSTFYSLASGNNDAVDGNAAGTGDAVYGQNTGTGTGVTGLSSNATGFGLMAYNTNTSGTGIIAGGNNTGLSYLTGGSGGAFNGTSYGIAAFKQGALTNNTAGGYFIASTSSGVGVAVAARVGGTNYKIINVGAFGGNVSTDVWDIDNTTRRIMFATESPEIFFQDYGHGKLVSGKAHVNIDSIFSKNIVVNENHPLKVFIQLEGDCNGVYVSNKTSKGFDVIELKNGTSNVSFTYQVTANRADYLNPKTKEIISKHEGVRFPIAPEAENMLELPKKEVKTLPKR